MKLRLRDAESGDIPQIQVLSREGGVAVWSAESLEGCLRVAGRSLRVAEGVGGLVVGFSLTQSLAGEVEILNLVVGTAWRRQGIGAGLLEDCLQRARGGGSRACLLEVRETNRAALALYQRYGFERRFRRKGYYQNPPADAWVMQVELDGTAVATCREPGEPDV